VTEKEVINAGPGPARKTSSAYYVDRKSVRDYKEALDYGKIHADIVTYIELELGDAIAVGEKVWLIKYLKPRSGKLKQKDLDDFAEFVDRRFAIELTFCSAMENECWTKCSTKDRCR